MIVAIDGPAGAGKSTVARALAERLGFRYLDTGAMYRALTWLAMRRSLDLGGGDALAELARAEPVTFDEEGRVWIAGTDVTSSIRDTRIDRMVPVVARHTPVREVMRERQRALVNEGDVVMEGRDIGTVIAPDADLKIYLTADAAERARRRHVQNVGAATGLGSPAGSSSSAAPALDLAAVAQDLHRRDTSDANRAHAPLQAARDAVVLDSSSLELAETVARVLELAAAKGIS
jgi:cytidylate kinase